MNKKEIQEKLLALWELEEQELEDRLERGEESLHVTTWQKCPNTAVEVAYYQTNATATGRQYCSYYDYGFAKVTYPDTWDAQYGVDLAARKALAGIARQIVEEG